MCASLPAPRVCPPHAQGGGGGAERERAWPHPPPHIHHQLLAHPPSLPPLLIQFYSEISRAKILCPDMLGQLAAILSALALTGQLPALSAAMRCFSEPC